MFTPANRGLGLGFKTRSYQRRFMGAYARSEFKRYYSVEHRRAGKDDSHFCARIQKAVKEEAKGIIANRWLVFPEFEQGRRAFWDNICGLLHLLLSFFSSV